MRNFLLRRLLAFTALVPMWFLVGFTSAPAQKDWIHDDEDEDEYNCFDVCDEILDDCMDHMGDLFNECTTYNSKPNIIPISCKDFNTSLAGGVVAGTGASHCQDLFFICNDNCGQCGFVVC